MELVGFVRLASSPLWVRLPSTTVLVTSLEDGSPVKEEDVAQKRKEIDRKNVGTMDGKKKESDVDKSSKQFGENIKDKIEEIGDRKNGDFKDNIKIGTDNYFENKAEVGEEKAIRDEKQEDGEAGVGGPSAKKELDTDIEKEAVDSVEGGGRVDENVQKIETTRVGSLSLREASINSSTFSQLDEITQKGSERSLNSTRGVGDIDVSAKKMFPQKVSEIVKAPPLVLSVTAVDGAGKFPLTKVEGGGVEEGKGGDVEGGKGEGVEGGKGRRVEGGKGREDQEEKRGKGVKGEKTENGYLGTIAVEERGGGLKSVQDESTIIRTNSSKGEQERLTKSNDSEVNFKKHVMSDEHLERGDEIVNNTNDLLDRSISNSNQTSNTESSIIQKVESKSVKNAKLFVTKSGWRDKNLTYNGTRFAEDETKAGAAEMENTNEKEKEVKLRSEDEKNNDMTEDENKDLTGDGNVDEDEYNEGNKDKNVGNEVMSKGEFEDGNDEGETEEVGQLRLDVSKSQIVGRINVEKEIFEYEDDQTGSGKERGEGVAKEGALRKSGSRLVGRWRREAWMDPKVSDHRSAKSPVKGELEVTSTAEIARFSPSARRREALQAYSPSYLKGTLQPLQESAGLRATLELYNPLALRKSLQPYEPPPSSQDTEEPYKKMSSIYSSWKSGTEVKHQVLTPFLPVVFSLTCLLINLASCQC